MYAVINAELLAFNSVSVVKVSSNEALKSSNNVVLSAKELLTNVNDPDISDASWFELLTMSCGTFVRSFQSLHY